MIRLFLVSLFFYNLIHLQAQENAWITANAGIGNIEEGESFEVDAMLHLENGSTYSFIVSHSGGEEREGVYQYDYDQEQWFRIAPRINQYGYAEVKSSGTRIFAFPSGNSTKIYELIVEEGKWEEKIDLPDIGLAVGRGIDALGDFVYVPCRVENDRTVATFADLNLRINEEFVMKVNVPAGTYELLRNANNPLLIGSKGGNPKNPIALKNGKVYHYSTFDYPNNDGYGGLYEWDGSNWVNGSAGLNGINITGSGFGPIGPIFSDTGHEKLFIKTEQGFYEKTEGGWFKYFYRTGGILSISPDYLYIQGSGGSFSRVDRALTSSVPNAGLECIENIFHFTNVNDDLFFAAVRTRADASGNCSTSDEDRKNAGIYKFNANFGLKGRVKNLHLETGTYLGGQGENTVAETAILADGNILVAGKFASSMGAPVTVINEAPASAAAKLLLLNDTGSEVIHSYVVGEEISDLDVNSEGKIAIVGDFGVMVLNADLTLLWNQAEDTPADARIAIADDGKVVVKISSESNGAGVIKLFDATGGIIHINKALDNNGVHIKDLEINTSSNHNQYYVAGFTQASSVLQVAYLRAYSLDASATQNWKTWGFGAGEINTNENGADTRLYRIVATDEQVYVSGESAGGGPGGFSIFAYNGKNLQTKVADKGNDFFTDGTNSCGSCHITYLARINPETGTAEKGKFFHGRLTNGKTNTHRVRSGDLAVDDEGNVLLVGEAAATIQDRDVFNVNGNLVGPYSGDQYVLMVSPEFNTRYLWGVFSKENGNGTENRLAYGNGKVAYISQTTKGSMITTENALRTTPFNSINQDKSLADTDVYFALWNSKVWESANVDEVELAFISSDSCFRVDDNPCTLTDPDQVSFEDKLRPMNMITPNGDGRNDTWKIEGLQFFNSYEIKVFNKNGQVVFTSTNYRDEWDGSNGGSPLPGGVYYYSIVTGGNNSKTGYVSILY